MTLLHTLHTTAAARRAATTPDHKATWGQFFTAPDIAAFMASFLRPRPGPVRILDPGAGVGILGAAAALAMRAAGASDVEVVAVESEQGAVEALHDTATRLREHGIRLRVVPRDFLTWEDADGFDIAIGNPPYFKLSPRTPGGGDAPNAYARFMEVAARHLRPGGELVFLVPRSYMSGPYFRAFRGRLHATLSLERAHLFGSRRAAFRQDAVLQENVIVQYRRTDAPTTTITVSSCASPDDLDATTFFPVDGALVLGPTTLLPADEDDAAAIRAVRAWPGSLRQMGLRVSTGPVVPFRTTALTDNPDGWPMLWMQHVRAGRVTWPLPDLRKPQRIRPDAPKKLLLPNTTLVLLRRLSAKEEARRLTAAVLEAGQLPGASLGVENHLNVIGRPGGALSADEAHGLAAVLTSPLVERYFRVANGHTQVNASDLHALPLPDAAEIVRLGRELRGG